MTIRYSAVANDNQPNLEYRPGGRWERILHGMLRENRPQTRSQIRAYACNPTGCYSQHTERKKLNRALRAMSLVGLVHSTPRGALPSLWEVTAAGERAVIVGRAA